MTSSQVPCPSPNESHATCTPDTTWPVSRHLPYSSWEGFAFPVLMSPVPFDASSVVHFRSSLSSIHDVFISRLLTVTFTTAAFRTEAAYGCLKPAPTNRLRRAYLHLRHSTVPFDTFMAQQTRTAWRRAPQTGFPPSWGDPADDPGIVDPGEKLASGRNHDARL